MDRVTIRYSAAAVILATVAIAVSAWAESGQYQPPARPVDPNARLPGVIQLEQFLNKNGVTGLNTVKGQSGHVAPSPPAQPAPASQPESAAPRQPLQLQADPAAPPASDQPAPVPRRETRVIPAKPPMIPIAAPEFGDEPVAAAAAPAPDASVLYAPPVRPPWWERFLSSRGFLYAAAFCLIVVPAAVFAASAVMGRRREERDLALYD